MHQTLAQRIRFRVALSILTVTGLLQVSYPRTPQLTPQRMAALRSRCLADGAADYSVHNRTGFVRFIGTGKSRSPLPQPDYLPLSASPEAAARGYLNVCGPLFGLEDQTSQLVLIRGKFLDRERSVSRFQQVYRNIPVLGAELVVNSVNRREILSAGGKILPDVDVNTTPAITALSARERALQSVAGKYNLSVDTLRANRPELWIFNPLLLQLPDEESSLVWRMDVITDDPIPIRELVLIDAQTGETSLSFNQVPAVLDRKTYTANNQRALPGTPVCDEADPGCSTGDAHARAAHTHAADAYNFYLNTHGRDGIDGRGMTIESTVHYGSNYANAAWNRDRRQIFYGDAYGYPLADDVVAHEYTHGVTQFESGLFNFNESGAISESLSDVWGEFVDQTNLRGDDSAGVLWLIGEDVSGLGAQRSMQDPTVFGHPDRKSSSLYYHGLEGNGGIHRNSGVNNKAAYLMTDGGTFNRQTIRGLGLSKVARIYYEAQTNLLWATADYVDLHNQLYQACVNIAGTAAITMDDCAQVRKATTAVEMDQSYVVWTWGDNTYGQMGDGATGPDFHHVGDGVTAFRVAPARVSGLGRVVQIAQGPNALHVVALTSDGRVWVWGSNWWSQLYTDVNDLLWYRSSPVRVNGISDVVQVAAGFYHTLALKGDGTVWAWGRNGQGQLGNGSTNWVSGPSQVIGLTGVRQIAAGDQHNLAVKADGSVWAWGLNGGRLGDGTTTNRTAPVQVLGLSDITQVAAGSAHSMALDENGNVFTWGNNSGGQLGDGSASQQPRTSPYRTTLTDVTQVAAGSAHSVAVEEDGTVWAWGYNHSGQLGDGSTTNSGVPAPVFGITDVRQVACGGAHTLAVKRDGTAWAWGWNLKGQLGDGTTTDRLVPTRVNGLRQVDQVAAGGVHSIALQNTHFTPPAVVSVTPGNLADLVPVNTVISATFSKEMDPSTLTTSTFTTNPAAGGMVLYDADSRAATFIPSLNLAYSTRYTVTLTTGVSDLWGNPMPADFVWSFMTAPPPDTIPPVTMAVPPGGIYVLPQTVSLVCNDAGGSGCAGIYYTIDGSTPTLGSPIYSAPIGILRHTILRFFAVDRAGNVEAVKTEGYAINNGVPPVTTATPPGGAYSASQAVTLTVDKLALIYYTLDGSAPSTASPVYSSPIVISRNTTLRFFAVDLAGLVENVRMQVYAIGDNSPPATTAAPPGGLYTTVLNVSLSANELATIYYTTDGSTPTTSSTVYTGPIAVARSTILTYFAMDPAGNREAERSQAYAIRGGTVWAWGYNGVGQIGDGTIAVRISPVQVGGLENIVQTAGGQAHTIALANDGALWAWGYNASGQLGDGTTTERHAPVRLAGVPNVVQVEAGESHSLVLRSDGTVWAWGMNTNGQLGDGTTLDRTVPVQVVGLTGVTKVAGGDFHTLALKRDGTVWAWGSNGAGELGDGTTTDRLTPVQVIGLTGVRCIAAGGHHSVAVKNDGTVWAWGLNLFGQLGDGTEVARFVPVQVGGLAGITMVAAGWNHTVALASSGMVWAWGLNTSGQLGDGTTTNRSAPVSAAGLSNVAQVAAGLGHTMALRVDGTVWGWGGSLWGQVGDGSSAARRETPVQVVGLADIQQIASGFNHTVALKRNTAPLLYMLTVAKSGAGTATVQSNPPGVACGTDCSESYDFGTQVTLTAVPGAGSTFAGWGGACAGAAATCDVTVDGAKTVTASFSLIRGAALEWGDGTWAGGAVPGEVIGIPDLNQIAAGGWHSIALDSGGTVWTWGHNESGQLGNGLWDDTLSPVQTSGVTGIVQIAGGQYHTMALDDSGTVWTWGLNEQGQLGDGTTDTSNIPVQVSGLAGVSSIAAGHRHTIAARNDGTVWAWGANFFGQLGDDTTEEQHAPVQVVALTDVIQVAAGAGHSLALKSDGTVWSWGDNALGQLGDETNEERHAPVQVTGLTNVIHIACGAEHSMAVKGDGTVWAWGNNFSGQLGDGTNDLRFSPVRVPGLADITRIAGGAQHSLAVRRDGTLWAWGDGTGGQLGNGTWSSSLTPARVTEVAAADAVAAGSTSSLAIGTLVAGTPALTSLAPYSGRQGQQSLSVAITGRYTHFVQGTTSASFGEGITVVSFTVDSPTAATALVNIAPAATAGTRTVTLTTGAEAASVASGFTVVPGTPAIASVAPNSGRQGQQNLSVSITGQYTHFAQGATTANFGAGITVASVTVNSPTGATALVNIEPAVDIGVRNVSLSTAAEVVSLASGFTVVAGTPAIASVAPNSGRQGQQNLSVSITGQYTHFVPGTTAASFGAGITVVSLAVSSPTSATALVNIDSDVTTGVRDVTLTTAAEIVSLAVCFTVQPGAPAIVSLAPDSGLQGQQDLPVAVTARYTHFAEGTTIATFGEGITVSTLTVASPTSATAVIAVEAGAAPGPRTVILITGAEVVSLTDGFGVGAATPSIVSVTPNSGQQGQQNLSVAIAGRYTHFAQGTTTASFGPGITVVSLAVNSPTSATALLHIDGTAITGARDVTLTTGTETVSLAGGFTVTARQVGTPRFAGSIASRGTGAAGYFVDLRLTNNGTGRAVKLTITGIVLRTLSGSGTVTLTSPVPPLAIGDLDAGASTVIRLYFNRPPTVTRFSITETGTVEDLAGTKYNFSIGQSVIP